MSQKESKKTTKTEEKENKNTSKGKKEVKSQPKKDDRDTFSVGDTVRVFYKIMEAGKERLQPFEGIVIAKKGKGVSKTFTVRRIGVGQIGVERIFPLYSPKIDRIEVVKKGKVRRSKLYYLRDIKGKRQGKIKEKSSN